MVTVNPQRGVTSGTTGPPKRIDLGYVTLERVLAGAKHDESRAWVPAALRMALEAGPDHHPGRLQGTPRLNCLYDFPTS